MKKDKTPFLLRLIQWGFPKLEHIAPSLANRLFVKIFFTPLRYKIPEKEKAIQAKAEIKFLNVEGKRICTYSWGTGPGILLVHGWAGRASQFRRFIEVFVEEGFRVIGFDGPAHGNSEGKSTNILEFETVLKEVYKQFGEPHGVIAHSFGGGAVLQAAMNGLPVSKLINIASPTIANDIVDTYLRTIRGTWKTGNAFKSYIEKKYQKPFDHFTSSHFIRNLKQQIDLLLVHDEDDKEVGINQALELQRLYPRAKLLRTKGLGHTRILKDDFVIIHCVTFMKEIRLS